MTSITVVDDFITQKALVVIGVSHCGQKFDNLVHIKRLF